MDQANSIVCICETHEQELGAMKNLHRAGIMPDTISAATRDVDSSLHTLDYYQLGDQTFTIPGIGPMLVTGPLSSWIATAFRSDTGDGEVSMAGAGLASLGIPRNSILQYDAVLKAGGYLLIVHGQPGDIATAIMVIGGTTHCSHTIHGETVFDTVHRSNLVLGTPAYPGQA